MTFRLPPPKTSNTASPGSQVYEQWIVSVNEFYTCHQQLVQQLAVYHRNSQCPDGQLAQLQQAMHELISRLTQDATLLSCPDHLSTHAASLQALSQRTQISLWLAATPAS